MNLKNKKTLFIAGGAGAIIIIIALTFLLPSSKKQGIDSEVISKRVKINLQNETAQVEKSAAPDASSIPAAQKAVVPVKEAQKTAQQPVVPTQEPPKKEVKPEPPVKAAKAEAPAKKEVKPEVKKASESEPVKEVKKENGTAKKALKPERTEPKRKIETVEAKAVKKKAPEAVKAAALKPWAINVASFPSLMDAQNLVARLKAAKFNAYITEFKKEGIKWYRVRVGFFTTKDEALKSGKKIQSKFRVETPWVVKPAKDEAAEHIK